MKRSKKPASKEAAMIATMSFILTIGLSFLIKNNKGIISNGRKKDKSKKDKKDKKEKKERKNKKSENNNDSATTVSTTTSNDRSLASILSDSPLSFTVVQNVLLTRRTQGRFDKPKTPSIETLQPSLDRAVACGQAAPNHKRTEPVTVYQIVQGTDKYQALMDIIYKVVFVDATKNEKPAEQLATKKQSKWKSIPVFLIVTCKDNQETTSKDEDVDDYVPLSYKPPKKERQLEDYATACAAIQNIMLSLHAENIGSKWATGSSIHVKATKKLIGANPTDRIVGIIMVGGDSSQNQTREYRNETPYLIKL